jgi:SAM-dependent methyltransferase
LVKAERYTQSKSVYDGREAQRTLQPAFMTPYHKQAQWAELSELKKIIGFTYKLVNRPLVIFDIGIGDARVPLLLSEVATWSKIAKYVGIDISETCLAKAKRNIEKKGIAEKVRVIRFDATKLDSIPQETLEEKYDLVICTYFTGGDFKPDEIKIQTKEGGLIVEYDISALRPNKKFVSVFKGAYRFLAEKGKIVIGSLYWNNDFVRRIQEEFYRKCGMTVITSEKDEFTATKEGFWSERFDVNKIYSYLYWVPKEKIELIPLDDYDFAFMVVVSK